MSTLARYYLGIAVGTVMLLAFLITKSPVFFVAVAAIWIYYATIRCPNCRTFVKRNRRSWWRLPAGTCLTCGHDLTKP
jgi:hypothetical protein